MRRVSVLGSTFGALAIAGACATAPGNGPVSRYGTTPAPVIHTVGIGTLDSIRAQTIADREGPGGNVRAEYETISGSRRARAVFHLDDDAYVMIGHIDPDGIVRIVFPNDPNDDGFVKGNATYRTAEFLAGFNEQYRYRYSTTGMYRTTSSALDSYDGGVGYVFMIAAWRPMRFDAFKDGANWDSYELASLDYLRDPRPAIQELASLLVGDTREAYTLKFARYFDSQQLYAGNAGYSSLGFDYCAGSRSFGFASPFFNAGLGGFNPLGSMYQYGSTFTRRGTTYYYDRAGDCYRTGSPYYYGFGGLGIAQNPNLPPPVTGRPRAFDLEGRRKPAEPSVVVGHTIPKPQGETPAVREQPAHFSPEYRQRGLITNEDPPSVPPGRAPRIEPQTPATGRARPTLEQMTNRHADGQAGAEAPVNRSRMQGNGASGNPASSGGEQRTYQRPEPRENPRVEQPRSEPSPRTQAPARSEPAPRVQAPERSAPPPPPARSEPPAARSAPPPSSSPPASSPVTPVKPPTA